MSFIHKYLDKSRRKTFEYERAANFLLEFVLLVVGALPIVTSVRSGLAYGLVAVLRLYETELRREDASVAGRHAERGGVLPLPSEKVARAEQRTKTLALVTWIWPGLAALVQAAESKLFGVVLLVSVGTTLVRVAWGRVLMPAWRKSRVEWKTVREAEKPKQRAESLIATIQLLGDSPKDIANDLRYLADRIQAQGTYEQHDDDNMIVHVREWPRSGGEAPIDAGKYWAVGCSESFPGEQLAFFADKEMAERMASGKSVFDEEDGPPNDMCVTRARMVGTIWNSYDPDPEEVHPAFSERAKS